MANFCLLQALSAGKFGGNRGQASRGKSTPPGSSAAKGATATAPLEAAVPAKKVKDDVIEVRIWPLINIPSRMHT